jgi:hypothetical protein
MKSGGIEANKLPGSLRVSTEQAGRSSASASAKIDKSGPGEICAISVTESDAPVGFELKVKFAVAHSAQPVVFDRFPRGRSLDGPNDPAVTQVIQLLVACRIKAFAQHVLAPGSANFRPTPF